MKNLLIKNRQSVLEIDLAKGRIVRLEKDGENLCAGNEFSLFEVCIIEETYQRASVFASDCCFDKVEQKENGYIISYVNKVFDAKVTVKNDVEKDEFSFRIELKNHTKHLIERVEFPVISFENQLDGTGKAKMLWPYNEGVLVDDIRLKELTLGYQKPNYPCAGNFGIYPNMVQSQFLAYLYEKGGLYIGFHDTKHSVKEIDFIEKDNRVKLQAALFGGLCYGDDFVMDYDVVFRFFDGEWQDGCNIYKEWYETYSDVDKIPDNQDLPQWYHESPLVVTFPVRGRYDTETTPTALSSYDTILERVLEISKKTDSKLLVLLMQWEGTAPWAPPYVWPPYGGEEAFKKFSKKIHELGHYLGLYCSGFGWTEQSKLDANYNMEEKFIAENFQTEMCVSPEQVLEKSHICCNQRTGYDFCPTSKRLKEIMQNETQNMFDAGVDYIQLLDQNHGGNSYFCYSKSHGHSHSPGSWQVTAVKDVLNTVKRDKRLLGCESAAAEPFIKNLLFSDNRWELNDALGQAVPAYSYIYHERINNFMGNQVCCPYLFCDDSYRYRATYSFLAGDMLTVVMDENGNIADHWGIKNFEQKTHQDSGFALLKTFNAWRVAAKEYLSYGAMKKPKDYACDTYIELPLGQGFPWCPRYYTIDRKVKGVLSNAFSYAGKQVNFFVNYTRNPIEIRFPVSDTEKCYITAEDYKAKIAFTRNNETLTIAPLSVIMVEE